MRSWIWVIPALWLAGCAKTNSSNTPVQTVADPAAQAPASSETAAPSAPGSQPREQVVVPKGTQLRVRIDETVDTRRNRAGDEFRASLAEPVVLHGETIVPKGTPFVGHVTESTASGRLEGRAELGLTLDSFQLAGKDYRIQTGSVDRMSAAHKKRNLELIGGGSGLGALIGGIAGGGKGALIGAGAGAAAGTAGAAATGKKEVGVSAESLLTFPLTAAVKL